MFSVYGTGGRVFTGPLERLRDIAGVTAAARLRAVTARERDPSWDADASDSDARRAGTEPTSTGARGLVQREAVQAYTQAQAHPSLAPRHAIVRVSELMSTEVITVRIDATLDEAWQALLQHGIAQAPVLNAQGALVGLLLRADLLPPALLPEPGAQGLSWHRVLAQPVSELMWTPVPAVAHDTDVRRVARVLLDLALPGLPVVDAREALCGFVSRSDILRAVVADPPLDLWS